MSAPRDGDEYEQDKHQNTRITYGLVKLKTSQEETRRSFPLTRTDLFQHYPPLHLKHSTDMLPARGWAPSIRNYVRTERSRGINTYESATIHNDRRC